MNPAVPAALSAIVMHLLEGGAGGDVELRVGERDVPLRLRAPSRLVGRDTEARALETAFRDAVAGRVCAVLVDGPAGAGKTALVAGCGRP